MTTWLEIYCINFLIWLIIGLYYYKLKLGKVSSPIDSSDVIKLVFGFILPICFFSSVIIVGLLTMLFYHLNIYELIFLIFFPTMIICLVFLSILYQKMVLKDREITTSNSVNRKINECKQWLRNFDFLEDKQVEIQVYLRKNSPVGRLVIQNVSTVQKQRIENMMENLPEGIKLWVILKRDYGINSTNLL